MKDAFRKNKIVVTNCFTHIIVTTGTVKLSFDKIKISEFIQKNKLTYFLISLFHCKA